jgi:hypothetical protein
MVGDNTTRGRGQPVRGRVQRLTDLEFEEAIVTLEEGIMPFDSPEMLQRFAETIVHKLAEVDEFSGEDG